MSHIFIIRVKLYCSMLSYHCNRMKKHIWPPHILNKKETLDYIHNTGCSIGRFGDGEISLIAMIGIGFQKASFKLRRELIRIARSNDKTFLVCLPIILIDNSDLIDSSKKWWKANLRLMGFVWKLYFSSGNQFGDTQITRPWLNTQNDEIAAMCFYRLSEEWTNKDVLLIEGEKSRVGVGNDFLKNAKSVKRILCPVKNAYSKIDKIESAAKKFPKETVILLALGPTATVLAYRLHNSGYRALDIGHMDVEYEWWKMKATKKVPIKNKYVNEAGGYKTLIESEIDEQYTREVLCTIR